MVVQVEQLKKDIYELIQTKIRVVTILLQKNPGYKQHLKFVIDSTKFAENVDCTFSARVYMAINDMQDFPKCKQCGKTLNEKKNFLSLSRGFRDFCCDSCSANNELTVARRKQTCIENWGVDNVFKAEPIKDKCKQTVLLNYGVSCNMCSHEIRAKQSYSQRQYQVDDIRFDSSIELTYYLYCKSMKIACEYQPEVQFEYVVDGKTHFYLPDFKVNDKFVELKGAHFFKEDGTMQNPFDHTQDAHYEAKHQCMLKNDISIIVSSSDEYKKIKNYVISIYGKYYLDTFKISCKVNNMYDGHTER